MKSNAALDREIKRMEEFIFAHPSRIGEPGSVLWGRAFGALYALRWARGYREEYPSAKLREKRSGK